jgi:hypothetical protein
MSYVTLQRKRAHVLHSYIRTDVGSERTRSHRDFIVYGQCVHDAPAAAASASSAATVETVDGGTGDLYARTAGAAVVVQACARECGSISVPTVTIIFLLQLHRLRAGGCSARAAPLVAAVNEQRDG